MFRHVITPPPPLHSEKVIKLVILIKTVIHEPVIKNSFSNFFFFFYKNFSRKIKIKNEKKVLPKTSSPRSTWRRRVCETIHEKQFPFQRTASHPELFMALDSDVLYKSLEKNFEENKTWSSLYRSVLPGGIILIKIQGSNKLHQKGMCTRDQKQFPPLPFLT